VIGQVWQGYGRIRSPQKHVRIRKGIQQPRSSPESNNYPLTEVIKLQQSRWVMKSAAHNGQHLVTEFRAGAALQFIGPPLTPFDNLLLGGKHMSRVG
jgi:hypothetical protein